MGGFPPSTGTPCHQWAPRSWVRRMRAKRICLVSPQHLASNPRLVKEADALHEAGIAVRVIAGDATPGVRPLDDTSLAQAPWPVFKVGLGARPLHLARRFRQELARKAFSGGM